MHSASVNSEPGSNSPFKFGRFGGGKTLATSACIENEEELTLLCSCCFSIFRMLLQSILNTHLIDSLRPLSWEENRAPIRSQKPICQRTKVCPGFSFCFHFEKPGPDLLLPLDQTSLLGRTGLNNSTGIFHCQTISREKIFSRAKKTDFSTENRIFQARELFLFFS